FRRVLFRSHQVFLSTGWLKPVVRESLLYLHGDCTWPVRSTSLALAIASISSGVAKRVLYPLKAPAALGPMWRTQPSGTAGRTNREIGRASCRERGGVREGEEVRREKQECTERS